MANEFSLEDAADMGVVGGRIPARATQLPTAGHLRVRVLDAAYSGIGFPAARVRRSLV